MDNQQMTTKKALLVVGFMFFLIAITLITPARWVGVQPTQNNRNTLVLKSADQLGVLSKDTNRNDNPDWRDLLIETTSASTTKVASKYQPTEEDRKRLDDPNNLTASFSKNLYTISSFAKKSGKMTIAEQEQIVTNLITSESDKIEVVVYTIGDIKTATTDTLASKKTYGNDLGRIYAKAISLKLDLVDFEKIRAYTTSKDATVLESLVIRKNNASIILNDLLKMAVPNSAKPYHLLIINRMSEYVSVLDGLSKADTDPIRSTIAFNNYIPTLQALNSSFLNMQLYFKLAEVTFTSNEPGHVLDPGYTMK